MNMKELICLAKKTCRKCPYKLGTIKTIVNPCPQCRESGYQFVKQLTQGNIRCSTLSENEADRAV